MIRFSSEWGSPGVYIWRRESDPGKSIYIGSAKNERGLFGRLRNGREDEVNTLRTWLEMGECLVCEIIPLHGLGNGAVLEVERVLLNVYACLWGQLPDHNRIPGAGGGETIKSAFADLGRNMIEALIEKVDPGGERGAAADWIRQKTQDYPENNLLLCSSFVADDGLLVVDRTWFVRNARIGNLNRNYLEANGVDFHRWDDGEWVPAI